MAVVIAVGLALTAVLTWTASTLNDRNQRRMVELQASQAAAVLEATILGFTNPLDTALEIESVTAGTRLSSTATCRGTWDPADRSSLPRVPA